MDHFLKTYFRKVTVSFFLRHGAEASRPSTVYCLISIHGDQAIPFTTGIRTMRNRWDKGTKTIRGSDVETFQANSKLMQIRVDVIDIANDLRKRKVMVTPNLVRAYYLGDEKLNFSFIEVSKKFMEWYQKEANPNTLRNIRSRMRNVYRFLEATGRQSMETDGFTPKVARQYEDWLKTVREVSQNHAIKNMLVVKQVIKFAIDEEIIKQDPLPRLNMKADPPKEIVFLDLEELSMLEQYSFANPHLSKVRDIFCFSCHSGLSYADSRRLHRKLHVKNFGGRPCIAMQRTKTKKKFSVPLSPYALAMLDKYGDKLPVISNQKMNEYLREIALILNINKPLSTHVARKTAAMVWLNGGMSLESVASMLGDTPNMVWNCYAKVLETTVVNEYSNAFDKANKAS